MYPKNIDIIYHRANLGTKKRHKWSSQIWQQTTFYLLKTIKVWMNLFFFGFNDIYLGTKFKGNDLYRMCHQPYFYFVV